jgi:serine-type D-Ala-D-Ala carboxypeptidase (penicillin-binding protein 5/6)
MMGTAPFMTPDQSRRRRRRDAARRRRTRLRAVAIGASVLAILAGLGALELAGTHEAHGSSSAHAGRNHAAKPAVTRSQTGLPLGTPPLRLTGIGDPQAEPVRITFRHPPGAGLLLNLSTGRVLWQRDPYVHLRMASLTKMMTALITVQSAPPNARVLVTKEAVNMPGSKVGVLPTGRHVPLETLLYGLMLPSGNDAAVALAQHVSGTVSRFVVRMNEQAAKLGLGCTRYSSPSGYYDRGNYTCAVDLAELAYADLRQRRIAVVTRTYSAAEPFPIKGGKLYLYNNNPLLIYHYPGLTGLKTGYTEAAGRCLVATAKRHGVSLGVVLLHSPDPANQASKLLNRAFADVYHQRPIPEPPIPAGA